MKKIKCLLWFVFILAVVDYSRSGENFKNTISIFFNHLRTSISKVLKSVTVDHLTPGGYDLLVDTRRCHCKAVRKLSLSQ